ncbi:MAG: hypothetical protein LBL74_05655 [Bacteroidales bacterium]|jgi:hypothetical protein|nr:hypothetical protein [Bacteroidales bacterium]
MSASSKNFQSADALYNVFQHNLVEYLLNTPAIIPLKDNEVADLKEKSEEWNNRWEEYSNLATRTPVVVEAKNNARKNLTALLRYLIGKYITYNELVTDEQRLALGLTVRDKIKTPRTIPTVALNLFVESKAGLNLLRVRFGEDKTSRAIPFGADGFEIYQKFDAFSDDVSTYKYVGISPKNPMRIEYDDTQLKGAKVWYCVRLYNKQGEKGPWSNFALGIII